MKNAPFGLPDEQEELQPSEIAIEIAATPRQSLKDRISSIYMENGLEDDEIIAEFTEATTTTSDTLDNRFISKGNIEHRRFIVPSVAKFEAKIAPIQVFRTPEEQALFHVRNTGGYTRPPISKKIKEKFASDIDKQVEDFYKYLLHVSVPTEIAISTALERMQDQAKQLLNNPDISLDTQSTTMLLTRLIELRTTVALVKMLGFDDETSKLILAQRVEKLRDVPLTAPKMLRGQTKTRDTSKSAQFNNNDESFIDT